jgi:hypothetical protein
MPFTRARVVVPARAATIGGAVRFASLRLGGYHGAESFSPRARDVMSDLKAASIFPLPLAAFERYMLADDRPEYPMTFTLTLRLSGTIGREAFEEGVGEALARHPLLGALVDRSARRPCWILSGARRPPLDFDDLAAPLRCPRGEAIDLAREPGLRLWVRQGDGGAEVTGQFHHACCDAIGALSFLGDVLAGYAARVAEGDERPVPQPLALERLRVRGALGRGRASWTRRLSRLLGTLSHAVRFSRQRPAPLAGPPAATPLPADPEPFSGMYRRALGGEVIGRLREVAQRRGATVNDLLLRDMFLTIAAWNARWGRGSRRAWLRILMPTNMRVAGEPPMPAANEVSMSFLSRRAGACDDARRLLDGIHRETLHIKRTRRGLRFIHVLEWAQRLCGGMPRRLVGDRCFATVVLSNLGDAARWFTATFPIRSGRVIAGNLVLEAVTGAPPIRAKTSAAVMVIRCAGETSVSLRCDPRRFSPEHAEGLLVEYVDRLVRTSQETDS